jgi:catechol 2,3-dioxygenase-like lactoylglutathione lyase family enzyme
MPKEQAFSSAAECPMKLQHVGLVCASEENADAFYGRLLGLAKSAPKTLPRALSKAIFDVDDDLRILNYIGGGLHAEIFIPSQPRPPAGRIEHVCLEVGDLPAFLQGCRDLGARVFQISKGDSLLTFACDLDGNLFEIKEAAGGER